MDQRQFENQLKEFTSRSDKRFPIRRQDMVPVLNEDTPTTQDHCYTYVMHTGWAARILAESKPPRHVDIGSYLYFSSLLSAFIPWEFYDVRPYYMPMSNLKTGSADLTQLPFPNGSVESLSCLHTMEHVGLGRYGDKLDPQGDLKAASELQRVLRPNGQLLMVLPLNQSPRVIFNAHRLYSYEQVLEMFGNLKLKEFSIVPPGSRGEIMKNAKPSDIVNVEYHSDSTGLFWFTKP
jgi:hypothetical protein